MIILLLVSLFLPIGQFGSVQEAAHITNFKIIFQNGDSNGGAWGLSAVLIVSILVTLFNLLISRFKNFTLQKRVIIFSSLLLVGYYILFLILVLLFKNELKFIPMWGGSFPSIALILNVMSFFSVNKTEADIIAESCSFRLRD